jgi:hypothetical protein|uniref:Uncharacterized protein n=1 Tax=candidate division WOR-3 bacterium TaxID=2052148 RepID=A0A7V3RGH4_UNCW3
MAVGRFQVMATLQAARAFVLGLPIESAKSFGLNRAIFYAAAKRGFKKVTKKVPKEFKLKKIPVSEKEAEKLKKSFKIYNLGDEIAYSVEIKGKQYFMIGDEIQTEEDFARQVEARFGDKFKDAWEEAIKICQEYDRGVLLSQRYFYETIYKPRRDELAKKWSGL